MLDLVENHIVGFPTRRLKLRVKSNDQGLVQSESVPPLNPGGTNENIE